VENLFDTVDEPGKNDPRVSAAALELKLSRLARAIHDFLDEPALLAVQEVENLKLLEALAERPEIRAPYQAVLREGLDERGIDVGLLYRSDRVSVTAVSQPQGCTPLRDGLGPDGDGVTCDSDGNGALDGNRLFSRPPLVVDLVVDGQALTLVINHFKSKSEDTPTQKVTEPRRTAQAEFVAARVQEMLERDPSSRVAVLGDLNDFERAPPLLALEKVGLRNLILDVPRPERYTFIFRGVSQVLDHILISPGLAPAFRSVAVLHVNADFPEPESARRSSDHDPLLAYFEWR
jgi:predicted extracellular nuclease